jgi:hypothetical protein
MLAPAGQVISSFMGATLLKGKTPGLLMEISLYSVSHSNFLQINSEDVSWPGRAVVNIWTLGSSAVAKSAPIKARM